MDVLEWHLDTVSAAGCGVGDGAALYDARVIVAPGRLRHSHRHEDPLAREVGEGLPAHARDDDGGEIVATVAVGVLRSRGEVERLLPTEDVDDVGVVMDAAG